MWTIGKGVVSVHYTFRTLKEDSDIDKFLMNLPPRKRPEFIRNALRFYIQNKEFLYSLDKNISEIKNEIASLKEYLSQENKKDRKIETASTGIQDKNEADADELFSNIINQFLNM